MISNWIHYRISMLYLWRARQQIKDDKWLYWMKKSIIEIMKVKP